MITICQAAIAAGIAIGANCLPDTVLLTVYDPLACGPGETCLQTNGDGYFASMEPVSADWYGRMAACPPQLFGRHITLDGIGRVYCGDAFGSLDGVPVDTVTAEHIRVDVMWPLEDGYPPWNYWRVGWD